MSVKNEIKSLTDHSFIDELGITWRFLSRDAGCDKCHSNEAKLGSPLEDTVRPTAINLHTFHKSSVNPHINAGINIYVAGF